MTMSGPAHVLDLNEAQTYHLKGIVEKKLGELDNITDTTLVDYVMVLLANRHGRDKILNELEDFLGPMVVETFVDWLFQAVEEVKNSNPIKSIIAESTKPQNRIFKEALRVLQKPSGSLEGVAPTDEPLQQQATEETGQRQPLRSRRFSSIQDGHDQRRRRSTSRSRNNRNRNRNRSRSRSPDNHDRFSRHTRDQLSVNNDLFREKRRSHLTSSSRFREGEEGNDYKRRERSREEDRYKDYSRDERNENLHSPRRIIKYQSISSRQKEFENHDDRLDNNYKYDEKKSKCQKLGIRDARELLSNRIVKRIDENSDRNNNIISPTFTEGEEEEEGDKEYNIKSGQRSRNEENAPKTKCSYWPNCKAGDSCPFTHPSEPCKHFPNCTFGDACLFIHPIITCKFQDKCQNPGCNYQHSSPAQHLGAAKSFTSNNNPFHPPSAITCRFYPNCKNSQCPFLHPSEVVCKFAENCQKPACPFTHPATRILASKAIVNAPCRYGKYCAKSDCPFQHTQSMDTTSVSIEKGGGISMVPSLDMTDSLATSPSLDLLLAADMSLTNVEQLDNTTQVAM